eukprot:CAMPEP_0113935090 /NCGR_PEP_ID=MMETSP1339-20121228/2312_1 /TAXON_ID=94617 /ORGANISM="Fibrocapsa japonica" /LENGTH=366 /DNA_ID=CAMNT_0000937117 /DNA_START=78 /DNA_END=1178 /DNA_ORIENTATION=- /assembly_acc=CAM_ASM_000762
MVLSLDKIFRSSIPFLCICKPVIADIVSGVSDDNNKKVQGDGGYLHHSEMFPNAFDNDFEDLIYHQESSRGLTEDDEIPGLFLSYELGKGDFGLSYDFSKEQSYNFDVVPSFQDTKSAAATATDLSVPSTVPGHKTEEIVDCKLCKGYSTAQECMPKLAAIVAGMDSSTRLQTYKKMFPGHACISVPDSVCLALFDAVFQDLSGDDLTFKLSQACSQGCFEVGATSSHSAPSAAPAKFGQAEGKDFQGCSLCQSKADSECFDGLWAAYSQQGPDAAWHSSAFSVHFEALDESDQTKVLLSACSEGLLPPHQGFSSDEEQASVPGQNQKVLYSLVGFVCSALFVGAVAVFLRASEQRRRREYLRLVV